MMGLLRSFGAPQVCGISTGRRPLVPRRSAGGRSSFPYPALLSSPNVARAAGGRSDEDRPPFS